MSGEFSGISFDRMPPIPMSMANFNVTDLSLMKCCGCADAHIDSSISSRIGNNITVTSDIRLFFLSYRICASTVCDIECWLCSFYFHQECADFISLLLYINHWYSKFAIHSTINVHKNAHLLIFDSKKKIERRKSKNPWTVRLSFSCQFFPSIALEFDVQS